MVKRIVLILSLLLTSPVLAATTCFMAQENDQILVQEGECTTRYAPCSTFKIAISLMGYHEGILIDETHPEWPFKKGYVDWLKIWQQPHHPTTWMQHSCVWYSQLITKKIGIKKFSNYVKNLIMVTKMFQVTLIKTMV